MNTPYFVYKPKELQKNIKSFAKFQENGIDIFYALKANNHKPIIREMVDSHIGFDVASIEEIKYAIQMGVSVDKISFSAPSKFPHDIKEAIKLGVKYFAFDSEIEAQKILLESKNVFLFARIGTSSRNAAFNLSEKFGMSKNYLLKIFNIARAENWPLRGISFHIGSQNLIDESWEEGFYLASKYINLAKAFGIKIDMLNIGGGIPAHYSSKVQPLDYYIQYIIRKVNEFRNDHKLVKIIVEPGRAMVANTMDLLTTVIDVKPYKKPPLIIVDSSVFGGVIEALEHFEYPIKAKDSQKTRNRTYKVGGYSCDSYDIIKQEVKLPQNLTVGDVLVIEQAGAYTNVFTEFQMKPFPQIIGE